MKNSEIRARIDDYQRQIKEYGYLVVYDSIWMTNIIENLLARQAAVLEKLPPECRADMNAYQFGAASLGDAIRAILDPQPKETGDADE